MNKFSPALVNPETRRKEKPKNLIPVIDRAMELLRVLELRDQGVSIREFVEILKAPRTTVYRILNTLVAHKMVSRSDNNRYTLGSRLLTLATRVAPDTPRYNLATLARSHLERLSHDTGEGSKVSVKDGAHVLVVAAVQSTRQYALTVATGQRLPLHAGAASKVLLAFSPAEFRQRALREKLQRFTPKTIVSAKSLEAELARIRARGWAEDAGEQMAGVRAVAAPIRDHDHQVVGAVSVPFLDNTGRAAELVKSVMATAAAISRDIAAAQG